MTDCLRIIGENTAHFAGGSYVKGRWIDMMNPQPEETRTEEEVIEQISSKIENLK